MQGEKSNEKWNFLFFFALLQCCHTCGFTYRLLKQYGFCTDFWFENQRICMDFCKIRIFVRIFAKTPTFQIHKIQYLSKRTIFLTSTNLVIIFDYIERTNYIQFRAQRCQKYASHEEKLEIKVVQN